jgi:hypothetical protein
MRTSHVRSTGSVGTVDVLRSRRRRHADIALLEFS